MTTSEAISKKIKSLGVDEKDVKTLDNFDINFIENSRNNADENWHFFEKK